MPARPSLCHPAYLIKASTMSEATAGEGASTSRGSPRSMSSHRVCTCVSTGWKHLCEAGASGDGAGVQPAALSTPPTPGTALEGRQ